MNAERSLEQRAALAAKLCELRRGLKMTLEDVGRVTDNAVAVDYLMRLEKCEVPFPAPHILFYLASAYTYPYEKLMVLIGHIVPKKQAWPADDLKRAREIVSELLLLRKNAEGQIGWRAPSRGEAIVDHIRAKHIWLIEELEKILNP